MTDCIIIGAGISGGLTALELQQAGMDVLLLERSKVGGESSWAGGGIISPLYPWRYPDAVSHLAKYSQQHYPILADTLQLESGINPQYTRNGIIILDQNEQQQALAWAKQWQSSLQVLDKADLAACEPQLNKKFSSGLWMPDVAQIRNPRLVKAMAALLSRRRIAFREHATVTAIRVKNKQITGVSIGDEHIDAPKVIVAGGAWSGRILESLKLQTSIQPVKGQMIILRGTPDMVSRMILKEGRYIIPRRDGRILVGSTLEYTDFKKELTSAARKELHQSAADILPQLGELEVEHHWAGLRPGTDNGVPYIGQHPEIEGLYFNAGHFRNGVVLGPASAKLMADIVLERDVLFNVLDYGINAEH